MPLYVERTTINTISAVVHELREFTRSDWYGYASCVADDGPALIFTIEFSDGTAVNFVADDGGIGVDYFAADDSARNYNYFLELNYVPSRMVIHGMYEYIREYAEAFLTWKSVEDYVTERLGFKRI